MINLTINDQFLSVPAGTTVLAAAQKLKINIPTLCNHPDLCVAGNCRVCVVEQKGARTLIAACATPVSEGMDIHTNTLKVRNARKHIVELLLTEHRSDCTKCYKNTKCELQALANEFAFGDTIFLDLVEDHPYTIDRSSPAFTKDDSKCIHCQRCVRTCAELQYISAIAVANKGAHQKISSFHDRPMSHVVCTNCGQCVNRCPTGALIEKTYIDHVWDAIYDTDKHVVVQTAPAVRVALGKTWGMIRVKGLQAKWLPPSGSSDLIRCSILTSALTLLLWKRELNCSPDLKRFWPTEIKKPGYLCLLPAHPDG